MRRFLRTCVLVILCALFIPSCCMFSTHTDLHQVMLENTEIKHIRTKSWLWQLFADDLHTVIGDTLYVDPDSWSDVDPGSRADKGTIIHENVHALRQKEAGVFWWVCQYIFSIEFRLEEEQIAIEAEWRYRIQDGERFTAYGWKYHCEREAKNMSRAAYGMITYDKAHEWVNEMFTKLYKEEGLVLPPTE